MSFLKSMKGALFNEDESTQQPAVETDEVAEQSAPAPRVVTRRTATPSVVPTTATVRTMTPKGPVVDETLVDAILTNIEKGSSQAYQRFGVMLDKLGKLPAEVRTQAAFAAADVTQQDIVAELDRRLKAVDIEVASVEADAERQRQEAVGGLQGQVEQIETGIQNKNEEITRLEEQIRLLREGNAEQERRKTELAGQIPGEEAKINVGLNKFRTAAAHVKGQINAERTTILGIAG